MTAIASCRRLWTHIYNRLAKMFGAAASFFLMPFRVSTVSIQMSVQMTADISAPMSVTNSSISLVVGGTEQAVIPGSWINQSTHHSISSTGPPPPNYWGWSCGDSHSKADRLMTTLNRLRSRHPHSSFSVSLSCASINFAAICLTVRSEKFTSLKFGSSWEFQENKPMQIFLFLG